MKSVQDIVDLASAYYGSAVLFAAIDCGVFEAVEKGTFDASTRGMRLLADACAAEGLLVKKGDGLYENTPAGRLALVPGGRGAGSRTSPSRRAQWSGPRRTLAKTRRGRKRSRTRCSAARWG